MDAGEIRVKTAIDAVYKSAGYIPSSKKKNDPETAYMMEQEARKRALSHLAASDRICVEECVQRLKETCPHCNLGDGAALQILMHLGIFLSQAQKYQVRNEE